MKAGTNFTSCSEKVAAALGPDVMKTVKPLIPDLLNAMPVLLYQGESSCYVYMHCAWRMSSLQFVSNGEES